MGMLEKFFGVKSATISSEMIRDEIARAESELATLQASLSGALSAVATMSDEEHIKAEADVASTKRAISRLEARVTQLNIELPNVLAAEQAAAKIAADEALRRRAEAVRKASSKEAAALLREYDKLAGQIVDILSRFEEISTETNAVNDALRLNLVAEHITDYTTIHRKHPDRPASEQREMRPCWVYGDGTVIEAEKATDGNYKRPDPRWVHHLEKFVEPQIESREVVVGQTHFRPGRWEISLGEVHLPPGFAGGAHHWPRT
jgi:hypothetical protein